MTEDCVKAVLKLQEDSEVFNDLTIEQLLYSCVVAVGLQETFLVLCLTNWDKWCGNITRKDMKAFKQYLKMSDMEFVYPNEE